MKDVGAPVLATAVGSLLINLTIELATYDAGEILIGAPVTVASVRFIPLTITSWSSSTIDDLVFSVPTATSADQVIASGPLRALEPVPNTPGSGHKRLSISGIPSRRVSHVVIPVPSSESAAVTLLNAGDKNVTVRGPDERRAPFADAFRSALITTFSAALVYGALAYFLHRAMQGTRNEIGELRTKQREIEEERRKAFNELEARREQIHLEAKNTRQELHRIRIYLLARIRDYSRELEFWRRAVGRLLSQLGAQEATTQELVATVTRELQTFKTLHDADLSDVVRAAELMLHVEKPGLASGLRSSTLKKS